MYFSPYTGKTYTVSSGNCPSFLCINRNPSMCAPWVTRHPGQQVAQLHDRYDDDECSYSCAQHHTSTQYPAVSTRTMQALYAVTGLRLHTTKQKRSKCDEPHQCLCVLRTLGAHHARTNHRSITCLAKCSHISRGLFVACQRQKILPLATWQYQLISPSLCVCLLC
jgi:hypothetical protein